MNLPADFISSIGSLPADETALLLSALDEDASVSFRLNPFKAERNPMAPVHPLQRVPWSQWGFYLDNRPAFTFDPLLHAGYYYVQEASSMFVEQVVNTLVTEPAVCLDLCAAPGGKSLSLLSALPAGSLLVSNETVRQRAHVLSETMTKFGHPNMMVANNRSSDFAGFPSMFDLILVDAPCSGEGMFRKDETAVKEWSAGNVAMCAERQREILTAIWPALKPGGWLIYSTCTYNRTENEENAFWAAETLGAEFVPVPVEEGWGISLSLDGRVTGYRFFPHKTRGEGLFVTVLRKTGVCRHEMKSARKRNKKNFKNALPSVKERSVYAELLCPGGFDFVEMRNRVIALPAAYSDLFSALHEQLKTISMGIELGERKGKNFIPSHSLAMSKERNPGAFPRYEVSYAQAVSYLRREAIALPDAPGGYLLLTYQDEPLGFVKNLGSRANNLYPGEWRIRSARLPANKTEIFTPPVLPAHASGSKTLPVERFSCNHNTCEG